MADDTRQVIRNEETVVAGEPEKTVVSQTQTSTESGAAVSPAPAEPTPVAQQSTVQTTTATSAPSDQVVMHNVAERVVDPAAERAAAVDWVSRLVWFIVGLMAILLAIRFVLLLAGANENAGFAQLIYGLTGWMVAPFAGLFGRPITYPGAAGAGVLEFEALVAIVVYILIGWLITKIAELMLGTNRTTGTVISETRRKTKV
jgi:uncharacterized protein YggT (Ycf19 family)